MISHNWLVITFYRTIRGKLHNSLRNFSIQVNSDFLPLIKHVPMVNFILSQFTTKNPFQDIWNVWLQLFLIVGWPFWLFHGEAVWSVVQCIVWHSWSASCLFVCFLSCQNDRAKVFTILLTFIPAQVRLVPFHGCVFLYRIPPERNVIWGWGNPSCCTGARISLGYKILQQYLENNEHPFLGLLAIL